MSDALKPILLVVAGLIVIFSYIAAFVFQVEIGVWLGLLLLPIMSLQIYIWSS
ncbi:MAG: hypothetical protein R3261_00670 [Alphaproteobacteria bacterium]|nr:hypothetical protein [Alphaproteobacteria bacterium]